MKQNRNVHILSTSHEGKVVVVNFYKKEPEKTSDFSEYLSILDRAKKGLYPRFLPMRKMSPSEELSFEQRLQKLEDIIDENYDEDRVEFALEEARFIQKALIHSSRF